MSDTSKTDLEILDLCRKCANKCKMKALKNAHMIKCKDYKKPDA